MKEIRFRYLWKGKWYYIDFIKDNLAIKWGLYESRAKTTFPEQFTGLKDKNGKEIFEGDILNWDNECTILINWVEDRNIGFGYKILTQKDKRVVSFDIRFYRSEESSEIIGNIYENPKLIKSTRKKNK